MDDLTIDLRTVVLDCTDVNALADFYINMLGWVKEYEIPNQWLCIQAPSGGVRLAFQSNPDYVPPTWPEKPEKQQQMLHIDFCVSSNDQMKKAIEYAITCGATKANKQYSEEWTVMLDPAGHPFCFVVH
ncbi:catechol-2,3-dioxygenase [Aequitasia blattaphilus]|uniref:VOC family protein n=1 Tax=Aequitasia blattaphilus TaxID=2949332 RepID=A0ABT1EBK0_9FIRM|nr:VOC family protein [Aequitasia blattaphilus]MCP1103188.1 VOC family protein [Aequitasia blattaphilus]MCR8615828.1 VOC family protein [Aequitasia blattaphilus]